MNKLMKHVFCMLLCVILLCAGLTVAATAERIDLIVFAPASMREVMIELRNIYEVEHPETYIFYDLDSSSSQRMRLEIGGDCDIFISAMPKQMDQLDKEADPAANPAGNDFVLQGTRFDLLESKVVLAVPEGNPKGIESYDALAQGLRDGTIRLSVVAGSSVIGQYTEEILAYYGLDEAKLEEKGIVTYAMTTQEVMMLVSEGEVDCGIVYSDDAYSAKMTVIDAATTEMCGQVIYPAAVLNITKNEEAARDFLAFLTTETADTVFEAAGLFPIHE